MLLSLQANIMANAVSFTLGLVYIAFIVYTGYYGYNEFSFGLLATHIETWQGPFLDDVYTPPCRESLLPPTFQGRPLTLPNPPCSQPSNCSYFKYLGNHSCQFS
jgi:hypothetical protein